MNDKVIILMATYNGERYLAKQLDSIIGQRHSNWELWVRDDASTDATNKIIASYANKDKRIRSIVDGLGNMGCVMNFSTLLMNVVSDDYVMFSDQDDVWLPFKIEMSLERMKEMEKNDSGPSLVYTAMQRVDDALNTIPFKKHPLPSQTTIKTVISQNYMYGCTMLLNSKLVRLVNPISTKAENHDYWVALIASFCGKVSYLKTPTILYRQHDRNVSGNYKEGFIMRRLARIYNQKHVEYMFDKNQMIEALISHLRIKNVATRFLDEYLHSLKSGGFKALCFILRHKTYKYGTGIGSNVLYLTNAFLINGKTYLKYARKIGGENV